MVVTSISPTEHSVRPKLRAWRSYSSVSEAIEETKVVTLTEPLRMSERNVHRPNYEETDGGREDDSESDSDDESRATRRCMVSTDSNNGTVS